MGGFFAPFWAYWRTVIGRGSMRLCILVFAVLAGPWSQGSPPPSAYDAYVGLLEEATAIWHDGPHREVVWKARVDLFAVDEDGAGLRAVTRFLSPGALELGVMIARLDERRREQFLRGFFSNYLSGGDCRVSVTAGGMLRDAALDVVDGRGRALALDLDSLGLADAATASFEELKGAWAGWLAMTKDRPFSFLSPLAREDIFTGEFPGLDGRGILFHGEFFAPRTWKPLYGQAERYIDEVDKASGGVGWAIGLKAGRTYSFLEETMLWFQSLLDVSLDVDAISHQKIFFQGDSPNLDARRLAEILKVVQAYIALDEAKRHKFIAHDAYDGYVIADRGLDGLWTHTNALVDIHEAPEMGEGMMGIEFRAEVDNLRMIRLLNTVLASRLISGDWSGLGKSRSWTLIPETPIEEGFPSHLSSESLVRRFGVDSQIADDALDVLFGSENRLDVISLHGEHGKRMDIHQMSTIGSGIRPDSVVPLWNWTGGGVPFMGEMKRRLVVSMTRDFILQVARLKGEEPDMIEEMIRLLISGWARGVALDDDLRYYMLPKTKGRLGAALRFRSPLGRGAIDVGSIPLSIEYVGNMPLSNLGRSYVDKKLGTSQMWLSTESDLMPMERDELVERMAMYLFGLLGGPEQGGRIEGFVDAGGRDGHDLGIAYSFRDSGGGGWRIEWDGMSRFYDAGGGVLRDSLTGGYIKITTPLSAPTAGQIGAIYKTLEKFNVVPKPSGVKGSIGVGLSVFEQKPGRLARLLALFHRYRGILSLMFQHPTRTDAPVLEIDERLASSLVDFRGGSMELKRLLYDARYFNTDFGSRTFQSQIDLTDYLQDVIPPKFFTEDFDVENPTVVWRRQFHRQTGSGMLRFHFFDSSGSAFSSALQINLVRALLEAALNDGSPLEAIVQRVNHRAYLIDPARAYADLEELCVGLRLDCADYRFFVAEGLGETSLALRTPYERDTMSAPKRVFSVEGGWGRALGGQRDPTVEGEGTFERDIYRANYGRRRWIKTAHEMRKGLEHITLDAGDFRRSVPTGIDCRKLLLKGFWAKGAR